MPELAAALRAAAFLAVWLVSGLAVARLTRGRGDVFETTWWALALASVCGLLLARAGWFSFAALLTSGGVVALLAMGAGRGVAASADDTPEIRSTRGIRWWSCAAGMLAVVAAWPPFETFLGAADSTMYVSAGVHLARTGSYEVADTIMPMLPPELATAIFPSVGFRGLGPFIRLPGGLLTPDLVTPSTTPAFFPLVPVWSGVLAAIGGPALAAAVAPLGLGLAVWAVTLFAGETVGFAAAVATALVFVANFSVWWFGRFPMSEPLTIAFVWGGLVLLGRRAPFAAGVMLGLGALARAESLLFVAVAVALLAAWGAVRSRDLAWLVLGGVVPGLVMLTGLVASPNHHFAYIKDALIFTWLRMVFRVLPAFWDGRLVAALALLPLLPFGAGIAASRRGGSGHAVRILCRTAVSLIVAFGVVGYLASGSRAAPLRHLGWLATSLSPVGLGLAIVGLGLLWRRGGLPARLAVVLVLLVAAVFIPKPQISAYQPWAMRRFLPIVLPGLALGVGAVVDRMMGSPRRGMRAAAMVVLGAVLVVQARPIWAIRHVPYFGDSLESVRRVADAIPAGALVVVDSGFADLQLQVPLWLVFDRETVVVPGGRPTWESLLTVLLGGDRPVYWIQNRLAPPPRGKNLVFTAATGDKDLTLVVPDGPGDAPPAMTIRKLVPLGVYGVTVGSGSGEGDGKFSTTF